MADVWILAPDPNGTCCDCAGRTNPCDSCGSVACQCALLLLPFEGPYATYAAAVAGISSHTSNCVGYYEPNGSAGNSFSATFNGTTISSTSTTNGTGSVVINFTFSIAHFFSLSLLAGKILSIPFSQSATGDRSIHAYLKDCNGAIIVEASAGTESGTLHITIPSSNIYYLEVVFLAVSVTPQTYQATFSVTCSGVFTVNPVIAQWDDSGTTRQLEACPRLTIPVGAGHYASQSIAQAILDSYQVSNCVGFLDSTSDATAPFVATNGGSNLTLSQTNVASVNTSVQAFAYVGMAGSTNLIKGSVLSVRFTLTMPSNQANIRADVTLFDNSWNLIEDKSQSYFTPSPPLIDTFTFIIPYTGNFFVYMNFSGDQGTFFFPFVFSASAVLSSNVTATVNLITALYNVNLDCDARLECSP